MLYNLSTLILYRRERGYNAQRIGPITLITRILKNIYFFLPNVLLDIKFI